MCVFTWCVDAAEDVKYSKILSAAVSDIENIIGRERRELSALLQQEDTQVAMDTCSNILCSRFNTRQSFLIFRTSSPYIGVQKPDYRYWLFDYLIILI